MPSYGRAQPPVTIAVIVGLGPIAGVPPSLMQINFTVCDPADRPVNRAVSAEPGELLLVPSWMNGATVVSSPS